MRRWVQHGSTTGWQRSGARRGPHAPAMLGTPAFTTRWRGLDLQRMPIGAEQMQAAARACAHPSRRRCRSPLPPPPPVRDRTLTLRGELIGHKGWVTAIAAPLDPTSETLLSSSRCAPAAACFAAAAGGRPQQMSARFHACRHPAHALLMPLSTSPQRQDRPCLAAGQRR